MFDARAGQSPVYSLQSTVCLQSSSQFSVLSSLSSVFALRGAATHKGPSSGSLHTAAAAAHFKLIEIFQRFSPLPKLPVVSSGLSSMHYQAAGPRAAWIKARISFYYFVFCIYLLIEFNAHFYRMRFICYVFRFTNPNPGIRLFGALFTTGWGSSLGSGSKLISYCHLTARRHIAFKLSDYFGFSHCADPAQLFDY